MRRLTIALVAILCLSFVSCASLSNRAKWETITIQKPGWEAESWTYKRDMGQKTAWSLFGNDNDGVTPWFRDEHWEYWDWWWRNRFHNLKWHVLGYSWWEEGNPFASWKTDHLKFKVLIGKPPPDYKNKGWCIWLVKPKKRSWLYYRPYLRFNSDLFGAWWGWGSRGQYHSSIKFGKRFGLWPIGMIPEPEEE